MEVLVIISIIVAVICLTGAAIYILIELGLAAERANKRARVKKNMRKLATKLGNGSVDSGIGPCIMSRTMDSGPSRWDSDSEGDGDSLSTTSTSEGGTLTRVWVGSGSGPMYENFCGNGTRHSPTNDPGYHSRETLCSGPPRQAPALPPTPKPDEVTVDVGPGPNDQQSPYEEPDPIPLQEPEPPMQIEVTIGPGGEGEEGEFFYDE
ncbi:hypothetical protein [Orf virus]|nr:hypothetical protein [Orf virus]